MSNLANLESRIKEHFENHPLAERRKKGSNLRDVEGEKIIMEWILHIVGDRNKPQTSFNKYIQDGNILSKVMTNIVFNSVPVEDIEDEWGSEPQRTRVNDVIREMQRYGVKDVFKPDDLLALRDIEKVTRNLLELAELASRDKGSILPPLPKPSG